ncbi:hypothetical protein D3C81_1280700 [compost metagenome]
MVIRLLFAFYFTEVADDLVPVAKPVVMDSIKGRRPCGDDSIDQLCFIAQLAAVDDEGLLRHLEGVHAPLHRLHDHRHAVGSVAVKVLRQSGFVAGHDARELSHRLHAVAVEDQPGRAGVHWYGSKLGLSVHC